MKRQPKRYPRPILDRACGECRACCTVLGIPEIQKPAGQPCPHECPGGCSIYASRPKPCQDYECLWRQGLMGDEMRPDRSGIVVDAPASRILFVREVWPEASQAPQVQEHMRRWVISGFGVLVYKHAGGYRLLARDKSTVKRTFAALGVQGRIGSMREETW